LSWKKKPERQNPERQKAEIPKTKTNSKTQKQPSQKQAKKTKAMIAVHSKPNPKIREIEMNNGAVLIKTGQSWICFPWDFQGRKASDYGLGLCDSKSLDDIPAHASLVTYFCPAKETLFEFLVRHLGNSDIFETHQKSWAPLLKQALTENSGWTVPGAYSILNTRIRAWQYEAVIRALLRAKEQTPWDTLRDSDKVTQVQVLLESFLFKWIRNPEIGVAQNGPKVEPPQNGPDNAQNGPEVEPARPEIEPAQNGPDLKTCCQLAMEMSEVCQGLKELGFKITVTVSADRIQQVSVTKQEWMAVVQT